MLKNFIERCKAMAKKATKKVVAKPVKKPAKAKAIVSKKSEPDKKIKKSESSKKAGAPKKAPVALSAPAKSVKVKVEAKSVVKPSKKVEKTAKVAVVLAPTKKEKAPKVKAVKPAEEVPVAAPVDEFESQVLTGKKGKKYEGATEEESKWLELRDKNKNIKPLPYRMSEVFLEKTPIEHKVLGWGFVLSVVNDRLEVLFRSGIKHLISNYKSKS